MTRREAREAAFLLLFEWSFRTDETADEILENAKQTREAVVDAFGRTLVAGVIDHYLELDQRIESHSDNWKLSRLAKVTLAVLRMGVYELFYMDDIPHGVTINEAVELMKQYATEDEAAFVNGVLGSIHRAGLSEEEAEADRSSASKEKR